MKRVFSGIQPSGSLHLGNYIGAIRQWVAMQEDYECIYCVVDLHALTVPQKPEKLKKQIRQLAALILACGVNPEQSALFVQSHNPDHTSLTWLLDCVASMGQLERMIQYKAKSKKQQGRASVGLFNYPALMAADILLYQTDAVPVGEDQKQHVELTRDLAEKFNNRYGKVFKLPEAKLLKVGARIMSLQTPRSKMSKSAENPKGTIYLLDKPADIKDKIMSAVTDSGSEVRFDLNEKAGISNLLSIYANVTDASIKELEKKYQDKGYGDFKKDLAEAVVEFLTPIQEKYHQIMANEEQLDKILQDGLEKVRPLSQKTLRQAQEAMGIR